jgi:2-methylcitrate dehydratase PrpD
MTKGFHAGRAALAGVVAALLAHRGFTSAEDILTGRFGFHVIFQSDQDIDALVGELGSRWALPRAGFKPYACGINLHAPITAVIALRDQHQLRADDVVEILLQVHPHVLVPTGKKEPKTGLDGKFSVYHTIAAALIDGAAGPAQFTDERVKDPKVVALRNRVSVTPEESFQRDEAQIAIRLRNGDVLEHHVLHPPGTADNPLTDAQLAQKFRSLVEPVFGQARASELLRTIDRLDSLPNVADLTKQLACSAPR